MNLIAQGFAWLFDPAHSVSTPGHPSIGVRIAEQFQYTGISVLFVVLIAVPIGLAIGHTGRGRAIAIAASNITRALPTLGLLSVLILLLGIGILPLTIVLVILGIPPLLAGVYSGIESVDKMTVDAARAVGMTELQIIRKVEIPLSISLLLGGFRAATLQVFATATVGSYFAAGGIGRFLVDGLQTADYPQMIAGAILVTGFALIIDGVLALVQRFLVPRGVSRGSIDRRNTARGGSLPVVASTRTLTMEGQ
jgi:osmoprotectant transport system permease protein